jgi:hypothetical protein
MLVDGEAEGWPANVLVDTTVQIDEPPSGARSGAIARTPQLCARWSGFSPVGSRFRMRAGLVADWLTPSYQSTVAGKITRLHIVWVPSDCGANGWPGAPMRLVETQDVRSLRRTGGQERTGRRTPRRACRALQRDRRPCHRLTGARFHASPGPPTAAPGSQRPYRSQRSVLRPAESTPRTPRPVGAPAGRSSRTRRTAGTRAALRGVSARGVGYRNLLAVRSFL